MEDTSYLQAMEAATPWMNGSYICQSFPSVFVLVEGENATLKGPMMKEGDENSQATWKFGDFGEAHPAVAEQTGKQYNNVQLQCKETWAPLINMEGVLSEDGARVTFWSRFFNQLDVYTWTNEEQIIKWKDSLDSAKAPSSHYILQPENQGKLILISGCICMGKSTAALYLSKMAGYVYYEADCFMSGCNPYLPEDVKEPTIAAFQQKPLKDIPKDQANAVATAMKELIALLDGKDYDEKLVEEYYSALCKDVKKERKRIGGDWVVAQMVPRRELRDLIRKQLGDDLVFVVLNMSKEDHKTRVEMRSPDAEQLNKKLVSYYDVFEPVADDEKNAITVNVTLEMTKEAVAEKILKLITMHSKA